MAGQVESGVGQEEFVRPQPPEPFRRQRLGPGRYLILFHVLGQPYISRPVSGNQVEDHSQDDDYQRRKAEGGPPTELGAHPTGDPPHQEHRPACRRQQNTEGHPPVPPGPPLGDHARAGREAGGVGEPGEGPWNGQGQRGAAETGNPVEERGQHRSQQHPEAQAVGLAQPPVHQVSQHEAPEQRRVDQPDLEVAETQLLFDQRRHRPETEPSQIQEQIETAETQQYPPLPDVVASGQVGVFHRRLATHQRSPATITGFLANRKRTPPKTFRAARVRKAWVYVPCTSRMNPAKGGATSKRTFIGTVDMPRILP